MSIKISKPLKAIKNPISFRPDKDVAPMLSRAYQDHPILTSIINECCRRYLTSAGYARKRDTAKLGK